MPHLSIEYSRGLEADVDMGALCKSLRDAMLATGVFPEAGIRVRAHAADHAVVADALDENQFAAMTLSVGAGRTKETLRAAGEQVFHAARAALAGPLGKPHFALSLEIREIDPDLSWKDTPIHARLSGAT